MLLIYYILCCKYCNSESLVKAGNIRDNQRYKCKQCKTHQVDRDNRKKYPYNLKTISVLMYLENVGLRNIGKIIKVPYQLVSRWIKEGEVKVQNKNNSTNNSNNIDILEIDELVTYFKKTKCGYGLLLTEIGIKLLTLKWEIEVNRILN